MYQKTFGRIRMKLGYVLLTALVSLEHAMKQVQDYLAYQVKELEYRK